MNSSLVRMMKSVLPTQVHKISWIISDETYVKGLWDTLKRYGINHTKQNHLILVDLVETELMDTETLEMEWSKEEYDCFVEFHDKCESA